MPITFKSLVAAALLAAAAAPAFAGNAQLIANSGLTAEQADGLNLNEIFQYKRNVNQTRDESQAMVTPVRGNADLTQLVANARIDDASGLGLTEIFQYKRNHNQTRDEMQAVFPGKGDVTLGSRSAPSIDVERNAQLIRAAGLTPEEAEGMTLNEIFIAKFNRSSDRDDRQG